MVGPATTPTESRVPQTAGKLYEHCQIATCPGKGWFSHDDRRFALAVSHFYSFLFQDPIKFAHFHLHWSTIYHPLYLAPFMFFSFPLYPFLLYVYMLVVVGLYGRMRALLFGSPEISVKESPFFETPPDILNQLNSECYIVMIERLGSYLQFGTNREGLESTKIDTITGKEYWMDLLDAVGARRPEQLALWSDGKVSNVGRGVGSGKCDLVCKIVDACMGRGDQVFKRGHDFDHPALGEPDSTEPLTAFLRSEASYQGKRAILCEFAKPVNPETLKLSSEGFSNVHSIDAVTVRNARGEVTVLSCIIWTDCTAWTSHTCSAGYIIDVLTETIARPVPWYAFGFAKNKQAATSPLIGTKIPGLHAALCKAIDAHSTSKLPWLTSVGWDLMITDEGPIFFEGNVGSMRTPRRIFLDEKTLGLWQEEIGASGVHAGGLIPHMI